MLVVLSPGTCTRNRNLRKGFPGISSRESGTPAENRAPKSPTRNANPAANPTRPAAAATAATASCSYSVGAKPAVQLLRVVAPESHLHSRQESRTAAPGARFRPLACEFRRPSLRRRFGEGTGMHGLPGCFPAPLRVCGSGVPSALAIHSCATWAWLAARAVDLQGRRMLLRGSRTRLQSFKESSKKVSGGLDRALEVELITAQMRQIGTRL